MRTLAVVTILAFGAASYRPAGAADPLKVPPGNASAAIESCVSREWIQFGSADESAVLDAGDQRVVIAEMRRRYPVLERDGLPISRIVLWRKAAAANELIYVAVVTHPDKPDTGCFIATFAAGRFDATPGLARKYLLPESPR